MVFELPEVATLCISHFLQSLNEQKRALEQLTKMAKKDERDLAVVQKRLAQ